MNLQLRSVQTRFHGATTVVAIVVLAALVLSIAGLMWAAWQHEPAVRPSHVASDASDLALYGAIIEQMRLGSDYYVAAHDNLVANGYGTQSVFNWRLPTLSWLIALLPSLAWAQATIVFAALVAGATMTRLLYRQGGWVLAGPAIALLIMSFAGSLVYGSVLLSELLTGVLIVLSAALYGLGHRRSGLVAGAAALFIRELAGVYVLVCLYAAWRNKRYAELVGWLVVLALYALYFALHMYQVKLHTLPTDLAYPDGWLQFGGFGFILETAAFNGAFMILPMWGTALLLPPALLGLMAWPRQTGLHAMLTVLAYIALFGLVGKPFNIYWGALYTPLMTLGLMWFPFALADLIGAISRNRLAPSALQAQG